LGTKSGISREENGDETAILVRLKEESRNSLQEIENISINSPLEFSAPLKQVAEITEGYGHLKIDREHQIRKATVTANIFDRDLGTTINKKLAGSCSFKWVDKNQSTSEIKLSQ